jgi:hypothetical protein
MYQDSPNEWRRSKFRVFAVILGFGLALVGLAPQGIWILFGSDQPAILWGLPIWICIVVTACYAVATRSKVRSNIALCFLWAFSILNAAGCARWVDGFEKATGGRGFL